MSADRLRERYEAIRAEAGAEVTVVAATKYVSVDDLGVLAGYFLDAARHSRAQADR